MKYLFVLSLLFISFVASSQTIINLDSVKHTPKTEIQLAENATKTTYVATYKGINYPVYESKTHKPFIIIQALTSKNWYRKYFKWEAAREPGN